MCVFKDIHQRENGEKTFKLFTKSHNLHMASEQALTMVYKITSFWSEWIILQIKTATVCSLSFVVFYDLYRSTACTVG